MKINPAVIFNSNWPLGSEARAELIPNTRDMRVNHSGVISMGLSQIGH